MTKKKYEKPNIYFESFEFCENVAYGCIYISHYAEYDCPVDTGAGVIFEKTGCDFTPVGGNDTVCYHVPTVSQNAFTS